MNGIVTFYINVNSSQIDTKEYVNLFKELNQDLIKEVSESNNLRVAVVPTFNESCRMEILNFHKDGTQSSSRGSIGDCGFTGNSGHKGHTGESGTNGVKV